MADSAVLARQGQRGPLWRGDATTLIPVFGARHQERRRGRQRVPSDLEGWLAGQSRRAPPSLRVRDIAGAALLAGRRRLSRVVTVTALVYVVLGAGKALGDAFFNPAHSWPQILGQVAFSAVNVFGVTFLTGFFIRAVGAAGHALPEESTWQVLRTLPYRRLIGADLLVTLCTAVGFVFLILPGFVVFTLLALTGAAVKFEHRSGVGALRRSAHIVRRHFWTVLVLASFPLFLGDAITKTVEALVQHHLALYFLVRLVAEGTAAAVCGLMQSELGYRLLAVTRAQEEVARHVTAGS